MKNCEAREGSVRLSLGEVSVRFPRRKPRTVIERGGSAQEWALCSVAFPYRYSPSECHFPSLLMGHSDGLSVYNTN